MDSHWIDEFAISKAEESGMDADRFDQVTRTLAAGANRRRILKGLAGSVTAGLLTGLGIGRAGADPNQQQNPGYGKGGNPNPRPQGKCGRFRELCPDGSCAFLGADPNNCGACGTVCESGRCCGGQCTTFEACPAGSCVCCNPSDFSTCTCVSGVNGVGNACRNGSQAIVT